MLPWKQAYERWRSDLTLNIQLYVRFNWGAAFAKFSRSYFTLRVWASLPVVALIPCICRRKLWRGSVWEHLILPQRFSPEISKLISDGWCFLPSSGRPVIPLAVSANTHLSDLLDLGASLADERAALAGRDDQPQGDRRLTGHRAVSYQRCQVLRERRRETSCGYTDSTSSIWLKSSWQQSEVITCLTSKRKMDTK